MRQKVAEYPNAITKAEMTDAPAIAVLNEPFIWTYVSVRSPDVPPSCQYSGRSDQSKSRFAVDADRVEWWGG
jgi:hypothetical protein